MAESYFEQALHNFIKDFNYAGAIDHLADCDYTLSGIRGRIGAHLSDSYLREQILKSYQEHGKLLLNEPGTIKREKVSMIKETNAYGRVSYRQVRELIDQPGLPFSQRQYRPERNGSLESFLWKKAEDGRRKLSGDSIDKKERRDFLDKKEKRDFLDKKERIDSINKKQKDQNRAAYISLRISKKSLEEWQPFLGSDQLDYLEVFPDLKEKVIYLALDQRVRSIINCLYQNKLYQGYAFFMEQKEKWKIGR